MGIITKSDYFYYDAEERNRQKEMKEANELIDNYIKEWKKTLQNN